MKVNFAHFPFDHIDIGDAVLLYNSSSIYPNKNKGTAESTVEQRAESRKQKAEAEERGDLVVSAELG
ncbi:hypothetical protein VNO78_20192 [Psophocarpus tetragonolobus]|uniref:Uncharacterized protein n=1 Tax=Psophocarpus tetragonolobus TaxID=3891 RepID=A0AAN9S9Y3_PSOTE